MLPLLLRCLLMTVVVVVAIFIDGYSLLKGRSLPLGRRNGWFFRGGWVVRRYGEVPFGLGGPQLLVSYLIDQHLHLSRICMNSYLVHEIAVVRSCQVEFYSGSSRSGGTGLGNGPRRGGGCVDHVLVGLHIVNVRFGRCIRWIITTRTGPLHHFSNTLRRCSSPSPSSSSCYSAVSFLRRSTFRGRTVGVV